MAMATANMAKRITGTRRLPPSKIVFFIYTIDPETTIPFRFGAKPDLTSAPENRPDRVPSFSR
ncbi:MAG: hypothetical protein KDJ80_09475 [Nitratireductor sp.]|nr:hypothetical protein [Nitratireductor sp.]